MDPGKNSRESAASFESSASEQKPSPEQHLPHHEVFSASRASHLDTRVRRVLYRPDRIAEKYVKPGDHVLDFGCGPGFFTREFAKRCGERGRVIAVDLQKEMLQLLQEKLRPEGLLPRVRTHQCAPDSIGLSPEWDGTIDVAFTIFVVHEVPDSKRLLREIHALLKPGGLLFFAEPLFIVPGTEFQNTLLRAKDIGFELIEKRRLFVNRAALLKKT
jgi:ubiquinone/menaquinone biosynthesis C-methylase UbiE